MAAQKGNKYAKGEGRPTKYKELMDGLAYKYCLLGCTDKELATFLDISVSTLNEWKKQYPSFSESITQGKEISDLEVVQSLYKGAQDRIVTEQQAFKVKEVYYNDEGKRVEAEKIQVIDVEKTIPADFRNQQFWLKNRRPHNWRDSQNIDHTTKGEKIEGYKEQFLSSLKDDKAE